MKTLPLFFAALFLALPKIAPSDEMRQWTNAAGIAIIAELISLDGEKITLKRDNGRQYTFPLSSLSQEDQLFARQWKEEQVALDSTPKPKTETLMTEPGKVIFQSDLTKLDGNWRTSPGKWTATEQGLSGIEVAADDHAAVMKRALPLKDVIIEFDVLLGETKSAMFGIDDAKDHLCRVTLTPSSFQARKDDNDHEGPDSSKPFNKISEELETDEWHTVRIELLGEEMVAQTGDHISLGRDPILAREKAKWGFIVSGDTAAFRNLTIWEALPREGWEKTGARLRRRLDIED